MVCGFNCIKCGKKYYGNTLREAQEKADSCDCKRITKPVVIKETFTKPEVPAITQQKTHKNKSKNKPKNKKKR